MKEYIKHLSIVIIGVFLFVSLEHVLIFKSYESLQETCKIILERGK